MIRTYAYPLRPTKAQKEKLSSWLDACRQLYNAALEERIGAWQKQSKTLSLYDQYGELTELRKTDSRFGQISQRVLRSALSRLDRAYRGFFRRAKSGDAPGFPRFKSRDRYDSFGLPEPIFRDRRLHIPSFGSSLKVHLYRPLPVGADLKEALIKRTAKGWKVCLVLEMGGAPAKGPVASAVGIDVGLSSFVTTSGSEKFDNPRFFQMAQEQLASRQQSLARKKRGSSSRRRARGLVARTHLHVRNQRLDFCRKLAKLLVTRYDLIAFEDLNIKAMVHGNLAKSIHDASWGLFIRCLSSKAEEAGKTVIAVNPRGTSQKCSGCGEVVPKDLSQREHSCPHCGLVLDRDHNAAINILRLGLSLVTSMGSADPLNPKLSRAKPLSGCQVPSLIR